MKRVVQFPLDMMMVVVTGLIGSDRSLIKFGSNVCVHVL